MISKVCSKCKIEKLVSCFGTRKTGNRIQSTCKECHKVYRKEYQQRAEVIESHRLRASEWRKNNPERYLQASRKNYNKHSIELNEKARWRYKNDPIYRSKKIAIDKNYRESGRRNEMNKLNPRHRLRAKEWRENNHEKNSIRQKKYVAKYWNGHQRNLTNELHNSYIIQVIKKQANYKIKTEDIPLSLIEVKKQSLKLKRILKNKTNDHSNL